MSDIKSECCKCHWKGLESEQVRVLSTKHEAIGLDVQDLVCPRCGNGEFWKLDDDAELSPIDLWGEDKLAEALKQLDLSDDYSIFLMASEVESMDSSEFMSEISDHHTEYGAMYPEDVSEILERQSSRVPLPKGWMLVGLTSPDGDKFGLVDYSKLEDK